MRQRSWRTTWWMSGVPTRREKSGATTGCHAACLTCSISTVSPGARWNRWRAHACGCWSSRVSARPPGRSRAGLCATASAHGLTRTLLRGLVLSMVVAERAGQTAGALARLVEFLGRTREVDYVRPLVRHREVSRTVLHRLLGTDLDTDVRRAAESMHVHVHVPATATAPIFSARERDVLAVLVEVGEDIRNTAIASRLGITEEGLRYHLRNIYRKTGSSKRADAVRYAQSLGLS